MAYAQQRLAELNAPDAELKFYFDSALVLPVRVGGNPTDVRLYMKDSLRNRAIDNWLASQWSSAAPGLRALQQGSWSSPAARQVQALSDAHDATNMVFSPEPRYWEHIKNI